MDRQKPVVGEQEHDHLEHVPGLIRSDDELLRRVSVRLEVDDNERVIRGVTHGGVADTVPSSRGMDLHTFLV
jgi:hypothetical protein